MAETSTPTPVVTFRINLDKTSETGTAATASVHTSHQTQLPVQRAHPTAAIPPPPSQLITNANSSNVLHRAFSMPLNQQNDLIAPIAPLQVARSVDFFNTNETTAQDAHLIDASDYNKNEHDKIKTVS